MLHACLSLARNPHPSVPSPKTGNPSVFEEGMPKIDMVGLGFLLN
jgi:hypothetical protein